MRKDIQSVMRSVEISTAAAKLEQAIASMSLTPQQQMAAIALLAARQVSVLPDAEVCGGEIFGQLVEIALAL